MSKFFYSPSRYLAAFFFAIIFIWLGGCSPKRNLVYLSDVHDSVYTALIANEIKPRIQPGDMLTISVLNVDPETSNLLNNGLLPIANSAVPTSIPADAVHDYLVDQQGNVNFPSVGKITLANLSIDEATEKLLQAISKTVKGPIVKLAFKNFKISVIGEVNKPGVFTVPDGRVNLFEALALAGDMTGFGMRENVWVMHEENGKRSITHVDLNRKEALQATSFYLQQNDIVYVTPDKLKERQARTDTRTLSIVVAAATLITVILSRLF